MYRLMRHQVSIGNKVHPVTICVPHPSAYRKWTVKSQVLGALTILQKCNSMAYVKTHFLTPPSGAIYGLVDILECWCWDLLWSDWCWSLQSEGEASPAPPRSTWDKRIPLTLVLNSVLTPVLSLTLCLNSSLSCPPNALSFSRINNQWAAALEETLITVLS